MHLGNKNIRYAITKVNGNMREVIGAKLGSGSPVEYTQPTLKLGIKNNGSDNTLTVYSKSDATKKGSCIIKDDAKNVYYWGWIDGNEIDIVANSTIWTHEQTNPDTGTARLAYMPSGDFEIVNWSGCNGADFKQGFQNSKGLTKVPDDWPEDCTSIAYCLKGCDNLHDIPNWGNLTTCKDVREVISGMKINDLKIASMRTGLVNATNASKLLNNVKIDKDMLDDDEQFYYLYDDLKAKCTSHNDVFGARNSSSGKPEYTVKYWYVDANENAAYVIPWNLLFVPKEWGGFEGDNVTAHVEDVSVDACGLSYGNKFVKWSLADYNTGETKYYTVTNKLISEEVNFYSSSFAVVENSGAGQTHCYIPENSAVTWNSDGSPIPVVGEFTAKVHLYFKKFPGATVTPSVVKGEYVDTIDPGDYNEVFQADGTVYEQKYTNGIKSTCTLDMSFDYATNTFSWKVLMPCGDGKTVDVTSDIKSQSLEVFDSSGVYKQFDYEGTDTEYAPILFVESGTYLIRYSAVSNIDDTQSVEITDMEYTVNNPIDVSTATIEFGPYSEGKMTLTWTTYVMIDGQRVDIDNLIKDYGRYNYAFGTDKGILHDNSFSLVGKTPGTYDFVVNAKIGTTQSGNHRLSGVVVPGTPIDITTATIEFDTYTEGDTEITWKTYVDIDGVKTQVDDKVDSYSYTLGDATGSVTTNSISLEELDPGTYTLTVKAVVGTNTSPEYTLENIVIPEPLAVEYTILSVEDSNFKPVYYNALIFTPKADIEIDGISLYQLSSKEPNSQQVRLITCTDDEIAAWCSNNYETRSAVADKMMSESAVLSKCTINLDKSVIAPGLDTHCKATYGFTPVSLTGGTQYAITLNQVGWQPSSDSNMCGVATNGEVDSRITVKCILGLEGNFNKWAGPAVSNYVYKPYISLNEHVAEE